MSTSRHFFWGGIINFVVKGISDYDVLSLPSLMGYLKQAHEYYLGFNLPNIRRKLIEAIDCSGNNDIAVLIIRFYDEYAAEVKRHMEYENKIVFAYVEQLLQGVLDRNYNISVFAGAHSPIGNKLKELKDIIIRYYPEKNDCLLNAALLEILFCEQDELCISVNTVAAYRRNISNKLQIHTSA